MRNILSPSGREVLEEFAWSHVFVGFDFDGTLAPIVSRPDGAAMRLSTRQLLRRFARVYPTAVISGRSRADVAARISGTGIETVIGNHGVEPWQATPSVMATVRRWHPILAARLEGVPGVEIEDKAYSLTVHYRRSRVKKKAHAAILEAAASLRGARIVGGKQVVNILAENGPHKGLALERERDRAGCDTALFVGDDATDEDVFALDQPGRLLTIRVGASRKSQASYFLRRQADIDTLLSVLIGFRAAGHRQAAG
jgi:trehalose 6-phosphate phosphatase